LRLAFFQPKANLNQNHCAATGVKEASHRYNVVIFGETGAGKSSVVNLITGGQVPQAVSSDALGYTAETTVYDHDIFFEEKVLKVKLFDTPG
jgi:predicted GTPase